MGRDRIVNVEREAGGKVTTCPSDDFQWVHVVGMELSFDIPVDEPYGDRQVQEARDRAVREYDRKLRTS